MGEVGWGSGMFVSAVGIVKDARGDSSLRSCHQGPQRRRLTRRHHLHTNSRLRPKTRRPRRPLDDNAAVLLNNKHKMLGSRIRC